MINQELTKTPGPGAYDAASVLVSPQKSYRYAHVLLVRLITALGLGIVREPLLQRPMKHPDPDDIA